MEDQRRYYEDLVIGQEHHLGTRLVSRQEIIDFAKTWDPQEFHVDDQEATGSIFGGLSGSSLHTMCLMSLAVAAYPKKIRMVAALKVETAMVNPLRPDEVISFWTTILSKRRSKSRPKMGIAQEQNVVLNSRGEKIVEQNVTLMVECRHERDTPE